MTFPAIARLYSALYLPCAPAIAAYLAMRADSRARWRDYLGRNRFDGAPPEPGSLWVHAVSAGEALSVATLADELRLRVPELPSTLLTTTIVDALDVAKRRAAGTYPSRTFLPLDLCCFLEPLLDRVRPRLVVLSETDFWPNLLLLLAERRVPVYLVNGRISEKAGFGYRMTRRLLEPALSTLRISFVQREVDRARLAAAGVDPTRVRVRANTKYERPGGPPLADNPAASWLRASGRRVLVAGSTHAPEEEMILAVTRDIDDLVVVLAPRNPDRAAKLATADSRIIRWSQRCGDAIPAGARTIVVDTMGELDSLYSAADVVLVGGSFGGYRGHNFLEAAWHGKPILCGPDMANFASDVELFRGERALHQVSDAAGLAIIVRELLGDPARAAAMGVRARSLVEAGQGVSARIAQEIADDLEVLETSSRPAPTSLPRALSPASRPIRVLFTISSAGLGGGERHVLVLAEAMARAGWIEPTISCRPGGWLEQTARAAALPVLPLAYRVGPDLFTAASLVRLLFSGQFDLAHSHLNQASLLTSLAARVAGAPCVSTVHGIGRTGYYAGADRLIAVSDAVMEHLRHESPGAAAKASVVHTGLPPLREVAPAEAAALRGRLGIVSGETVFTAVGKLHPNKGHALLLSAAALLPRDGSWRILIVGSGPEESALRELAAGLDGRAVLAGEIDDPALVLAITDQLIVPSFREAFGLIALEAQMAGVPVAASDSGGLAELITPGLTGRLFPVGDVAALARLMAERLADPVPFLTQAGRARVSCARFSVDAMARATLEVYEDVLCKRETSCPLANADRRRRRY